MSNNQSYRPEEIINSINNLERAEPGYFLYTRIQQKIDNQTAHLNSGLKRLLVPLSACLLLFITMNVISYIHFGQQHNSGSQIKETPVDAFAGEYGFETSVY